ncbi:MAG: nitrilase-related carbon-nitrogen hydrolase [Candidatus Dormibacteria bacterium]
MKIAVGQFDVRLLDVQANLVAVARLAAAASVAGADLLLLPELATAGYAFADGAEMARFAEPGGGALGPALSRWRELAEEHGLLLAGGFPERADEGYYNSAAIVGREGVLGLYRKVHLFFKEQDLFLPGNLGFPVFDLPFGRVGMQLCYDTFFPEAARSLVLGGAELVLTPGNFVRNFRRTVYDARGYTQACVASMGIASQNQVNVALCSRVGEERDLGFIGASLVVGWDGWPIAGPAAPASEDLLLAELDLPGATAGRQRNPRNHALDDRRTDQYRTHAEVSP